MAMENDSSPDNEDECMKKRYSRKSFEVRQKQSLLSDSDDDNKEDSEHCIIGEKRSIGRSQWVQCDNPECQKWRRIDYVIDIDEVENEKWVCEMNKDEKKSACEASQETIGTEDEDDPCTTDHEPGMVLWGKVPGYPWWPCMVDNDPDIETFYWNEADESSSEQKTSIHVTFFGKQCTRAWLYPHSLRDFSGKENIKDMGSMKFRGTNFKNDVTDAFNDAKQSLTLSVKERISKYGFTIRYDGKEYAGNPEEKSEEPRKSIISKRKTMKQHMKRTGDKETGDKGTGNKGTGNKETGNKKTRNKEAGNTEKKSKKQKRDLSKKQKSSGNNETDKLEMCKHRGIAKLSKTQERIKKKLKGLKNLKMKDRCPRSVGHTKQDADRATNETEVVPDVYTESDDGNVQYEESCPVTLPKSPKKYRNSGLLDFCNEGDSMTGEQRDRGLMKSVEIREEIREEQSKASPAKRKTESWQLTREEINSVPSLVKPTLVPIDEKLISERAEKMMKKAKKNLKNGDNIDLGDEASSKEDSQETDDCQSKKAAKKPASKGSGRKQSSGKQAKAKPVVVAEEHEEKLDHLAKTDKQDLIECQKDVKAKARVQLKTQRRRSRRKKKRKIVLLKSIARMTRNRMMKLPN
ncbi:zinc finger CW-type PWWP domain protein 1-like [Rhopilema esculentum]|uniref:zinc finger CW-type PWWP domain protein 1-like n=1 Tax=Rhopilema esculentum TaxID=499914 RepID=UPI0031D627CC